MKITVKILPSKKRVKVTFSLDELNLTKKQWNAMTGEEKLKVIQKAVDELPEQPYWLVESFDTEGE
jgi:6-phosphogluconolactonase/glucosamine-6-phosphate isomerase/deaminase